MGRPPRPFNGTTKVCTDCGARKNLSEFHRQRRGWGGVATRCKPCEQDKYRRSTYIRRLRDLYGMTEGDYDRLLAHQGGGCALCGQSINVRLGVDHCHDTGKVRGILCTPCNTGLGLFGDRPVRLAAAIQYLAIPPARLVPRVS